MEQYIKKSALVAEIKRRKDICKKVIWDLRTQENKDYYQGKVEAYSEMAELIGTLEVKEVELEKNSLTWKDISATRRIMAECRRQMSNEKQILNDEELCKEVLKRFKAADGGD